MLYFLSSRIPDAEQSSVEVESEADVVDEGQSDKVMQLTARIEDLEAKLEEAKLIEAEKEKLESGKSKFYLKHS